MKDYIIASGNEKEFIKMAERLGYDELVFIDAKKTAELKSKIKITTSRRIFKSDVKKDRQLIEGRNADIIYEFEQEKRRDATHFRSSGLNHVLAKLMKEKKVSYGLSFSQLLRASADEQAQILGRMLQNIKLCRKYKVPVIVASFARHPYEMRDKKDIIAFARTLGLNDYKA
jgi:ribonuclease P/MRP protein subunit RPP1